jgi:hypothetical protein
LIGGYYAPDNATYNINQKSGLIEQKFKKQNVVQAVDEVQFLLPYTTYAPCLEQVDLGLLWFEEIIHLPQLEGKDYVYKEYRTGNEIAFPFSPVKATSSIKIIKFSSDNCDPLLGYPTGVLAEYTDNTDGLSQYTANNLELQFFDASGHQILINYKIDIVEKYDQEKNKTKKEYYITTGECDFYLPNGATIQIVIHSTTTEVVYKANAIEGSYISGLFSQKTEQGADK